MTAQPQARRPVRLTLGAIAAIVLAFFAFLTVLALPELARIVGSMSGTPTGGSSPSPSASPGSTSPMAVAPIGIQMPADADCAACHLDAAGNITTKTIPPLAHPLEGWRDCTACHADDRLVKSAPGHSSLHKADCLTCHSVPSAEGTAPPRPHHLYPDQPCVSCHGTKAPLPTDMTGRNNCWICHSGTEFEDLFNQPAQTPLPSPTVKLGG